MGYTPRLAAMTRVMAGPGERWECDVTNGSPDGTDPVARMLSDDLASASLGMRLIDSGPGRAVVAMRVADTMINGHAVAHGGYVFLLADTAFACACNSHGPVTVAAGA